MILLLKIDWHSVFVPSLSLLEIILRDQKMIANRFNCQVPIEGWSTRSDRIEIS